MIESTVYSTVKKKYFICWLCTRESLCYVLYTALYVYDSIKGIMYVFCLYIVHIHYIVYCTRYLLTSISSAVHICNLAEVVHSGTYLWFWFCRGKPVVILALWLIKPSQCNRSIFDRCIHVCNSMRVYSGKSDPVLKIEEETGNNRIRGTRIIFL